MTKNGKDTRIRYNEGCLAAHALNAIGDRWALLVVRELMFSGKRFQVIRAGMPGISAAVLTQRLSQLIEVGVVVQNPNLGSYGLTQSGHELLPVLQALCRWGAHHPGHDHTRFISPTALMISMTAMIDSQKAAGKNTAAGFRLGMESFSMRLSGDGLARVEATQEIKADFILEGNGNDLAMAVYGPRPLSELADSSQIKLTGDASAAQDFVDLFTLTRQSA